MVSAGSVKFVRQEDVARTVFEVGEADAAKRLRIGFSRSLAVEGDCLVGAQARRLVDLMGAPAAKPRVALGPGDEECARLREGKKAGVVDVGAVEQIDGCVLGSNEVERVDVMQKPLGDMDKRGNGAAKVHESVELDGSFFSTKARPGEKLQAQVDGGRIEGVDRFLQIGGEWFVCVKGAGLFDQDEHEVVLDAPVAALKGVGEGGARDGSSNARVIEFGADGAQADFDVAQRFAEGELGEGEGEKLIVAGEGLCAMIAPVALNTALKISVGKDVHDLRKDGPALVQGAPPRRLKSLQGGA